MSKMTGLTAASVLIALAIATPASAATTATADTATGQTLTITIDSPADGASVADNAATFSGHATLSPTADGSAGTTVTRVDWGVDSVYPYPTGRAPGADGSWNYSVTSNGPRDVLFTAVAADGTKAQADVHVTFPPYTTSIWARPLLNLQPPAMRALVFDEYDVRGPHDTGNTIDFYVLGQKVCSAVTTNGAVECSDNFANMLATAAGGYDAVFAGTAYYAASSDHATLTD